MISLIHRPPDLASILYRLSIGLTVLLIAAAPSTNGPVGAGLTAQGNARLERQIRWLNNLVAELAVASVTKEIVDLPIDFYHPRDGWVLIRLEGDERDCRLLTLLLDDQPLVPPVPLRRITERTFELMRWMKGGVHRLHIKREGGARTVTITIRALPELIFCKFGYHPHISNFGPYDWDFLDQWVLSHVNTIVGTGSVEERPFVERWKREGKRWVVEVSAQPFFTDGTAQQAFEYWLTSPGIREPIYDGIIADEFFGNDSPRYQAVVDSIRMLVDKGYKGKLFYPYSTSLYQARESTKFARMILDFGWKIAWERYLPEPPNMAAAEAALVRSLTEETIKWKETIPGCETGLIICFGYESIIGTETFNVDPSVDYKVWMDMQFQRIATDPAFKGVYGLMEYTCGYADEETVRWAARLYRHYGIEGETELLSHRYGFRFVSGHLLNADFEEGLDGWNAVMAETGSVQVRTHPGYGWLQGRWPRMRKGDTFLWMRRGGAGPNAVSQQIRGLTPGRLYSVKVISGDYRALKEGKSQPAPHGLSIGLSNVEVLESLSFDAIVPSNYAHHLGPFNSENRFWMNFYYRVFRPKDETGRLEISDWTPDRLPGGPIGQELMINFVELQPYLER